MHQSLKIALCDKSNNSQNKIDTIESLMKTMSEKKKHLKELIEQFKHGEKSALARLITLIENNPLMGKEIFKNFDNYLEKSYIIGITGPPGSGKSTLINMLAKNLLDQKKTVGIISIDPSSPFSGGAFL